MVRSSSRRQSALVRLLSTECGSSSFCITGLDHPQPSSLALMPKSNSFRSDGKFERAPGQRHSKSAILPSDIQRDASSFCEPHDVGSLTWHLHRLTARCASVHIASHERVRRICESFRVRDATNDRPRDGRAAVALRAGDTGDCSAENGPTVWLCRS